MSKTTQGAIRVHTNKYFDIRKNQISTLNVKEKSLNDSGGASDFSKNR